jgi:hypothetical protein
MMVARQLRSLAAVGFSSLSSFSPQGRSKTVPQSVPVNIVFSAK